MSEEVQKPNISPVSVETEDEGIEFEPEKIVEPEPELEPKIKPKKPHGNKGKKKNTQKATQARLKKLKENKEKLRIYEELVKNGIPKQQEIDYDKLADLMAEKYYEKKRLRKSKPSSVKELSKKNIEPTKKTQSKKSKEEYNIVYPSW